MSNQNNMHTNLYSELYTFLVNQHLSGIDLFRVNAVIKSLAKNFIGLGKDTMLFITHEKYLIKFILYHEGQKPFSIKKVGFKPYMWRLLGSLFNNEGWLKRGMNFDKMMELSQIKLERRVVDYSDQYKLIMYVYYSEQLGVLIMHQDVKMIKYNQ